MGYLPNRVGEGVAPMKNALINSAAIDSAQPGSLRATAQAWLPRLVLAPSFVLVLIFVYGFNLWTLFLSFTNSRAGCR